MVTGLLLLLSLGGGNERPAVRVLLESSVHSLPLECPGPVRVRGRRYAKLPRGNVTFRGGTFRLGALDLGPSPAVLTAVSEPFTIRKRRYAGTLRLIAKGSSFSVINEVDLETYVLGVVGAEIGGGSPIEAIKVQAVVSRSYAWTHRNPSGVFDLYDDTRSQVYVGVPAPDPRVERAVRETAGLVVTYQGRPVTTFFSSSCGGHTMGVAEWTGATEIPPLAGVECGYCAGMPNESWSARFTWKQLASKLGLPGPVTNARVVERTRSRRAAKVQVGSRTLSARVFVRKLGLRNTNFRIHEEPGGIRIEGHGWGHGVGLCQYGAINLAKRGKTFRQILAHYFPQARLSPAYPAGEPAPPRSRTARRRLRPFGR